MFSLATKEAFQRWKNVLQQYSSDQVYRKYRMLARIGTGKFSSVHSAVSKFSGNKYAIKVIEKARLLK